MLLANGQIEHPGKESSTASNTGLSRVTAQGDGAQDGVKRTETPNFTLLCIKSAGEFGCVAGQGNRCRVRGGEGVMLLRWMNLSSATFTAKSWEMPGAMLPPLICLPGAGKVPGREEGEVCSQL